MKHMIPVTTRLTPEQIVLSGEAIARRMKELAKLKRGDFEYSLFLMSEIAHIKDLIEYQKNFQQTT